MAAVLSTVGNPDRALVVVEVCYVEAGKNSSANGLIEDLDCTGGIGGECVKDVRETGEFSLQGDRFLLSWISFG